jgi:hypothetical protein
MTAGAEVRVFSKYPNELRGMVSDGISAYIIEKIPKLDLESEPVKGVAWNEDIAKYFGTLVRDGMLPKVVREYFYLVWENSTPAEKLL